MTTETARKIEYICKAVKWFDKVNGNTYHSVRLTRCSDGAVLCGQFQYGYGNHYQQTARLLMFENGWMPKEYTSKDTYKFERDNDYPIEWIVSEGLKRDCIANGKA